MNDTTKALKRRISEQVDQQFNWDKCFRGRGVDIGSGSDPLAKANVYLNCQSFDKNQGDANKLHEYFQSESFDYIHASHCLEHMYDPTEAFSNWLKVLKPGGYAIIVVPDWCLYEGMIWPSTYNPDHKSTWSIWLKDSPAPIHVPVPQWLHDEFHKHKVLKLDLIDTNYSYKIGIKKDQTLGNAEAAIEFVLQKT